MSGLRSLGDFIQRALFSTTITDVTQSLSDIQTRISELDQKLDREVKGLQDQIATLKQKQARPERK